MRECLRFRIREARARAHGLTSAALGLLLGGCAGAGGEATEGESIGKRESALIGGSSAAPDEFRSTVGIADDCTAAKVAPRLFLTAAHCVAVGRPLKGFPVPEPFPPNDGILDDFLPGQRLNILFGLDASDAQQDQFTIVATSIHPSWWACPLCQEPNRSSGGAADIAVVEIAEETPNIPEASVSLDPIGVGTPVVKVGWGCEERTTAPQETLHLGRFKRADAVVIPASEIQVGNPLISDDTVATVDASYVVTAGHDQDEANASLCLGDSGGPLYLPGAGDPRVVGVNSDYTFLPTSDGVSFTDWHTRTSVGSLHGVAEWLIALGVNTQGG
jgi:hypothetical protein